MADVIRTRVSLYPGTPLADAAEIFRTGTDRTVAVVAPTGQLLGLLREAEIARHLSERPPHERPALLRTPVGERMSAPTATLRPDMSPDEALRILQESCREVLPVVTPHGIFLGMVSGGDFLSEMARPLRPPMIGGLATPLGVYLTTGNVTGGVGHVALALTGLVFFCLHLAAFGLAAPANAVVAALPAFARPAADTLIFLLVRIGLLLAVLRLTPMAGYHAAEHQVVHAIERGEPLTVEVVRSMPRVHPRCGTNLVAGALVVSVTGAICQPLMGSLGYVLGGIAALAVWRDVGAWLQLKFTTRPASPRELESGLRAAREVLDRHTADPRPVAPIRRFGNMGFLPLFGGFLLGGALTFGLSFRIPALREPLLFFFSGW
ncbi:MAG: DUF1385 domain-containing protein [Capsulimonadales bacterium]|nr:DUF1385 domain-containing protein [Capsulimonadales bacterium]